jgi:prepilin-type N-terminal cleavage/methylation domain-containing protein
MDVGIERSRGRATNAFGRLLERWRLRDDAGMTLIECVVAIALLVIVLVPTTLFVIEGQRAASESHLEAEATSLADQALNGLQAEASRGNLPAGFQSQVQTVDEVGGKQTTYTVSTTWTPIVQGTDKSICAAGIGVSVAQQIWLVTASVTWNAMGGASPVTATSEIAPGTDGGLQQSAGELAVSLDDGLFTTKAGNPTPIPQLFTGSSVTATLTGTWSNTLNPTPPAVPPGEFTSETRTSINSTNSAFDGCLIFQDVDVDVGWTYTLSFAGNGSITQAQEFSDDNPNGAYTFGPITLEAGVPQVMTVDLNTGTPITISYTQGIPSPGASCTTAPTAPLTAQATTSEIPITVNNSGLTYIHNDWVAYLTGGPVFNEVYLYPSYSSVTSIWAGDGPNSEQATPCQVSPASGLAQTVYLQLYDLSLTASGPGASVMTATEAGGTVGAKYALSALSGATSATDMPLGEYTLSDGANTVTSGGNPATVWVTEGGNCLATAAPTPPSPCHAATITVVAP